MRNFAGGPVVKPSSSSAGGVGLAPGQEAVIPSTCLLAKKPIYMNNRSNIVTNSIQTLKVAHDERSLKNN